MKNYQNRFFKAEEKRFRRRIRNLRNAFRGGYGPRRQAEERQRVSDGRSLLSTESVA